MKRKLISFDAFESIKNNSLSAAEIELAEAAPVLSKAIQSEGLELLSYGPEAVLFEDANGTFVHANYTIKNGGINFENIEQLAIDDETEKAKAKETVSLMLDAVLESNEAKASSLFDSYITLPSFKRILKENAQPTVEKKPKKIAKKLDLKKVPAKAKKGQKYLKGKKLNEWNMLTENVFEYIDFQEYGPTLQDSKIAQDDKGDVTSVQIPTTKVRNEGKLLTFNWKTMKTDVKVLRNTAKCLCEDTNFVKAVAELKRHNNLSDNSALEEALENIVGQWPSVLYLTQEELSSTIKQALEITNATNYDDQTCAFMAEGILRTAHGAYVDRVSRIINLSGGKVCEDCKDKYSDFKSIVDNYYPTLDETNTLEMQVFVDLYEALREIYTMAAENRDEAVATETATHLNELTAIIQQKIEPTLEVAQAAAEWLNFLVETNLEMTPWNVSNTPYITRVGEHPAMAEKARKGYAPASDFSGKYPAVPVSDGKTVGDSEAGWSTIADKETYPDLNNPYVPKAAQFTMKQEKGADKEDGLVYDGGKDTWPNLQNPYVPKAETPQTYKMNQGNKGEKDDLVVDQ